MKKLAHRLLAATTVIAPMMVAAAPATYDVDPTHTFVTWEQMHYGTSTSLGRFTKNSGTVVLDSAAKSGRVELTLDMSGIQTGVTALDQHLQSPDFFDIAAFPTATFVGDKFTFDGDSLSGVSGQLTMKGRTFPVTLTAVRFGCYVNRQIKRDICGGDFEATIKRSRWGVSYLLNMGVADDTKLHVQVEAIKQQ